MTHEEFLEKQWQNYQAVCNMKGMDAGTKEDYIKRQTPTYYKPDVLLEKTLKSPCLSVKTPLFKAEENITIPRRVLNKMLEEAAKRGYELGIQEST